MAKVAIVDSIVHTCMNLRLEKDVKETTLFVSFWRNKRNKISKFEKIIISFLILLLLQRIRVYIVVLPTALVLNVNLAT